MKEKNRVMQAVEFEGWAITVDVKGGTQEYAVSFLHIFNNVRVSRQLYHIENHYDNRVTVYCSIDCKDDLTEYLSQFGEITSTNKVMCYQINECYLPDIDWDKYYSQIILPFTE